MLRFKINDKLFGLDRNELEGQFIEKGLASLQPTDDEGKMKKQAIKSVLSMALGLFGIQKPAEYKDMDTLEFAVRLILGAILNEWEKHTIEVSAEELEVTEDE